VPGFSPLQRSRTRTPGSADFCSRNWSARHEKFRSEHGGAIAYEATTVAMLNRPLWQSLCGFPSGAH
jgi:hypothetical protein